MSKYSWTPEDDQEIRQLFEAGKSVGAIAGALGKTRGQIAGRVWKLKLFRKPKDAAAE